MKSLILISFTLLSINIHAGSFMCYFTEPVDLKTTDGYCKYNADGIKMEVDAQLKKTDKNLALGVTSGEYLMNITCLNSPSKEIISSKKLKGVFRSAAFGHGFIGGDFFTSNKKHCIAAGLQAMSIHTEIGMAEINFGETRERQED